MTKLVDSIKINKTFKVCISFTLKGVKKQQEIGNECLRIIMYGEPM